MSHQHRDERLNDGPEFSRLGLVIKSYLGDDIRRIPVLNDDLTYDELMLMMQRVYRGKLTGSDEIAIKYTDEDGDLITVADSCDLSFAIQNCHGILRLTLYVNGEPRLRNEAAEVRQIRAELLMMKDKVERLLNRLELKSLEISSSTPPPVPSTDLPRSNESTFPDGGKPATSLAHATQPLSPMSGREFDPLTANQKAVAGEEAAQQKVLNSFGVSAAAAAVDGGPGVRSGTPDSVGSVGSGGYSVRPQQQQQQQTAGQSGYQHTHNVQGYPPVQAPYQQDAGAHAPAGYVPHSTVSTGYSQMHHLPQDPQRYAHHPGTQQPQPHQPGHQQPAPHQPSPQHRPHSQYIPQGAPAPASAGIPPPGVNPYSRGSAYTAHYPRPQGQFPPTQ